MSAIHVSGMRNSKIETGKYPDGIPKTFDQRQVINQFAGRFRLVTGGHESGN
jgi:uncharacterized protein YeaC (DUF1315 family)